MPSELVLSDPTGAELELRALLTLEVPLQRRAATGKQREAEAKLVKLERELQYRRELATTGVLDAARPERNLPLPARRRIRDRSRRQPWEAPRLGGLPSPWESF